jgi:MFS transporter, putative metabolite:H+ symporter
MTTPGNDMAPQAGRQPTAGWGTAGLRRPGLFWAGTLAVIVGVCLHIPMFVSGASMHYVLAGMPWDIWMKIGMPLIVAGLALVYVGLVPRRQPPEQPGPGGFDARAIDGTSLTKAHALLICVLLVAIAIDTIKPFTFTFILPSVAKEYGLSTPTHHLPGHLPVGLLPLSGIAGTVIGSFLWGFLGDRIGRRASILLACVIFIATAMCGAMAPFSVNIVICFVMGLAAGGLLPIAYALLTETIPARLRGPVIVLVAGVGTAAGFLVTSWLAHWLMPTFGWRIMWWIGLPTGLLLIALQRYIPESPRFLAVRCQFDEARAVMRTFKLEQGPIVEDPIPVPGSAAASRRQLLAGRLRNLTLALALGGLAWGLVNFGFIVWLPSTVSAAGLSTASVTGILAWAALFAFPGAALVAWLYGTWSSKGTVAVTAAASGIVLVTFAILGNHVARYPVLLAVLMVCLLVAMWGLISALSPYSAEVYPVSIRASGAGITAGASKFGGVAALAMSVLAVAPFSVRNTALIASIPMLLAAVAVAATGVETRYEQRQPAAVPGAASVASE